MNSFSSSNTRDSSRSSASGGPHRKRKSLMKKLAMSLNAEKLTSIGSKCTEDEDKRRSSTGGAIKSLTSGGGSGSSNNSNSKYDPQLERYIRQQRGQLTRSISEDSLENDPAYQELKRQEEDAKRGVVTKQNRARTPTRTPRRGSTGAMKVAPQLGAE
eukprot:CAMPEP_0118701758 /NCGR_PEP_ID=MMETSP0800-20121206/17454_1 /TAXON_ID=210618 ORGANISM="Striatella unipunctata, Strain CCMP2910" /NCGR_SAMPLE_ID=MMETSP0800 /ASSEMBLY_ACC=CAM_ASM_000638 /LENGTH=157 /DNA_ID=CAMNT_0006602765 /DNA_START=252 /DNA_END=725 /DNA_ORIENTATION=+